MVYRGSLLLAAQEDLPITNHPRLNEMTKNLKDLVLYIFIIIKDSLNVNK